MAYCVFCQHDQQALVRCTLRWTQVYTGTADHWNVSFNDLTFQLWFAKNKLTRSKDLHKIPYMVLGCYSSSLTATKGKHQLLVHQLLPLSKVSLVADSPWLSSTPSAETSARTPSPQRFGTQVDNLEVFTSQNLTNAFRNRPWPLFWQKHPADRSPAPPRFCSKSKEL